MLIEEILHFEFDISKTVDPFQNQKKCTDSVDLGELNQHKTCQKSVDKAVINSLIIILSNVKWGRSKRNC